MLVMYIHSSLNMKNAVLIVCALVAVGLSQINGIDAADVKLGEIPYQVSVQSEGRHFTSGVIISEDWIITSARRIFWESLSDMKVIAGTVDLREPFSTHQVIETHFYNDVVPDSADYVGRDIGVLKVSPPFNFSSRIGKAILPEPNAEFNMSSPLVVSGWGYTHIDFWTLNFTTNNILQKSTVHVSDLKTCRDGFAQLHRLDEVNFCTNIPVEQTGECQADYGGPITIDGALVAMSSWANAQHCQEETSLYLHTQLSKVIAWIREKSEMDQTCLCKCRCPS